MFENNDLLSDMLRNPLDIQSKVLEELENRTDGKFVLADGNNSFTNLLEFGSSISAACMNEIDNVVIPSIYARRAQTFKQISRHMSDFDYVNLFGTPAHTTIGLQMDTITLFDEALDYNEYYKKATIPADSVFTIGNYEFGIYYPIEIQINKINNNILVINNVNEEHPLHKLSINVLEHKTQTFQGVPLLSFRFPIYQFSRSYITEDSFGSTGFVKSYTYNHYFYACRIFTYYPFTKTWKEIGQTTSDIIYDPNVLTAKISIEPDNHKFNISIPQLYFDNNKMGTKVKIEVYTTQGSIDADISTLPDNAFTVSFFNSRNKNTDPYSTIFKKYPSLKIYPAATKIVGGNNGNSFEEVRERVINNISHRTLLITPTDITKYFEDNKFKVTKHLDNISNRIYFCNGTLTDKEGSYVPITNSYFRIDQSTVNKNTKDIVVNKSNSVTILPTAMFKYNSNKNYCEIMSLEEKQVLENMTPEEFVNELNTVPYMKTPFHVVVDLPPARYQKATSYNLFSTSVENIQFKYDNEEITTQMVGYEATIKHEENGSNGYTIRFIVAKTEDLKQIEEELLAVYVCVKDTNGSWCGRKAEFLTKQDDFYIYELHLTTDYLLENNTINITNIDWEYETADHVIKLESDFHVVYCVDSTMEPNVRNDYRVIEGLPSDVRNTYLGMGRQIFTLHLGHHLDDIIFNICDMTWGRQEYKQYEADEPMLYTEDTYELNEDGTIKIDIEEDENTGKKRVVTHLANKAGDVMVDEFDNIVLKHGKGEYMKTPNGDLIPLGSRDYQCLVYMMMIDARMYMSQGPTHENFIEELPDILESYFSTISAAKEKLVEQTELYYRPIRTIGLATFSIGDGITTRQQLDMSFRMKLHVPPFVKTSAEHQETIRKSIISITEDAIATTKVSMTDIATIIKNKLSNYVDNIDVLGINGDKELQTIHVLDDDAQASVARVLTILKDGTLYLDKDITLDFVATEQVLYT